MRCYKQFCCIEIGVLDVNVILVSTSMSGDAITL